MKYLWKRFERGKPEWLTILTNWNTCNSQKFFSGITRRK